MLARLTAVQNDAGDKHDFIESRIDRNHALYMARFGAAEQALKAAMDIRAVCRSIYLSYGATDIAFITA